MYIGSDGGCRSRSALEGDDSWNDSGSPTGVVQPSRALGPDLAQSLLQEPEQQWWIHIGLLQEQFSVFRAEGSWYGSAGQEQLLHEEFYTLTWSAFPARAGAGSTCPGVCFWPDSVSSAGQEQLLHEEFCTLTWSASPARAGAGSTCPGVCFWPDSVSSAGAAADSICEDLGPWPDSGFPIKAGTWFLTWLWVSCRRWCRFYLQKFHCFYHIQVIHNTDAFPVWLLSLGVFSMFIHVVTCISISFIYFIVPKYTNIYYSNHFKIYSSLGLITFTLLYNHTLNNHVQSIPIFTSKLCSH